MLDENSKIIVIDGPPAAGKTELGKALAEEFDMLYVPGTDLSSYYVNSVGFDLRTIDPFVPETMRSFSVAKWHQDPSAWLLTRMQLDYFYIKYHEYMDAVAHLLNTGQGVIMNRSVHSDGVFIQAMHRAGYIDNTCMKTLMLFHENGSSMMARPHVNIYLDVPVEETMRRLKERKRDGEENSKALTPAFLDILEDVYKREYLDSISRHSHTLIYDWKDPGDAELIVDEIEKLEFEEHELDIYSLFLKDWFCADEAARFYMRFAYTRKWEFMLYVQVPTYNCPQLWPPADDVEAYKDIAEHVPGGRRRDPAVDYTVNPHLTFFKKLFTYDFKAYRNNRGFVYGDPHRNAWIPPGCLQYCEPPTPLELFK